MSGGVSLVHRKPIDDAETSFNYNRPITQKPTPKDPGVDNEAFKDFGSKDSGVDTSASINNVSRDPSKEGFNDDDDELPNENDNCFQRAVGRVQGILGNFYNSYKNIIWIVIKVVCVVLYGAYFCYAMYFRFGDEGSLRLLVGTILVILGIIYYIVNLKFGREIKSAFIALMYTLKSNPKIFRMIKWVLIALILIGFIIFIVIEVALKYPRNLISGVGILVYVFLLFIFSYNPAKVKWRPVFWGLGLQFIFALLILRTQWGFDAFMWLGDRIKEFLDHADAGSKFVFGETTYTMHFFAFKVLPVVVFFSTIISMLYYLNVMQVLIEKIALVMQFAMGTTAAESMNAAGNIFIGQSEAPLMIRPLIQDMTRSELHAVMTGGFATIAGSVMAAYILMGVPANHLLSASVMSAPAALAMSKLFYPETQKSKTNVSDVKKLAKSTDRNLFEAASRGASQSIKLVANIAANLIAFLALLNFVNGALTWMGERVGIGPPTYPALTFQFISSYVFSPLTFVMGVDYEDCRSVAQLLGIKTMLNEFIAYDELGKLIANRKVFDNYVGNFTRSNDNIFLIASNTTLVGGFLTDRSEMIATYALCGFSNFGSIGIMLGALGAMAPHRINDLSRTVFRAMIAGNVACFLTACIAGLLYQPNVG